MGKSVNHPMGLNGAPGLQQNMNSNVPSQQPPIQSQNQQQQQQQLQQQQQQQQQTQLSNQLGPIQQVSQQRPAGLGAPNNGGITDRSLAAYGEAQRIGMGTLNGMTDSDRYGLNGLAELINGENQDTAMLALGTDLTQLGLDLGQPE